jgi:S-phase kinase-associated protein 1
MDDNTKYNMNDNTSNNTNDIVYLIPNDYDSVPISINKNAIMYCSELVKDMLEDDDDNKIPLPRISKKMLEHIVEFCNLHFYMTDDKKLKEIPKYVISSNISDFISEPYSNFINKIVNIDIYEIFELVKTANYMGIDILLKLSCIKIACMIKDKTPEEVKEMLNLKGDYEKEEMEELKNLDAYI